MNRIYWLASYPKSGNTWVRIFLTNYLQDGDQPADINRLDGGPIASDRDLFDRWAGVEASDLSFDEIADLRPHVYRQMALHVAHPLYIKVHDACTRNAEGELLFPPDVTGAVVYLMRNPLDVAVSYSHHGGRTLAQVVDGLCAPDGYVYENPRFLPDQLPQRLLSWSTHVHSWVDESGLQATVIRYEDLLANPEAAFERILRAFGVECDPERLRKAVAFSRFDIIQEQEQRLGFKERTMRADAPFFRQGRAGGWRTELAPDLADRIIMAHGEVMRRFAYLDENNNPTY
jgi:aryl sulfotransferase